jgi:hypothetical protein
MFRKPHALSRQLILVTALALVASGVARADDSSMNPFIGDSYKYFNGGRNLGDARPAERPMLSVAPADPAWRQAHPHGLSLQDLQAMSSSGLSAAAEQLDAAAVATAMADRSRARPGNWSEHEMQALSSSTLARWQASGGAEGRLAASAASEQTTLAQNPDTTPFAARVARLFRRDDPAPAVTP